MFSNPTAITFVGYLLVMVCVGFYAYYHTRSYGDYILGGRSLGGFVTALSVGASDMSGWLLMGLPGAVYLAGISQSWIGIGLVLGSYINWCVVASRLRVYTEKTHNALTLPDYFSHRFEDKQNLLRIIAAVVILLFFTIYCASGVVAGARLFENTFSMSYETALILGAAATICYVFVGGFLAVSWTDTIQALLMCLALIVTPIAVMYDLGGFTAATECVASVDIKMLNILEGHTLVGIVSLLAWGLGYFGQPHILVRFMATRSIKVIPNARRVATLWMSFCLSGAVAVGFFGAAFFAEHRDVASLVSYAWAGFGAAFGPVIIMSLWWRRMTRNGALAGMITGAVTVLVWNHYAWLGLYEILPGFVFALIAIVVVSLLDKAPSKSITKTFDEVQAAVRNPA